MRQALLSRTLRVFNPVLVACQVLFVGGLAQAQQVPDAASLLREQTKPALSPVPLRPLAVPGSDGAAPDKPVEGARILDKGFRILQTL